MHDGIYYIRKVSIFKQPVHGGGEHLFAFMCDFRNAEKLPIAFKTTGGGVFVGAFPVGHAAVETAVALCAHAGQIHEGRAARSSGVCFFQALDVRFAEFDEHLACEE